MKRIVIVGAGPGGLKCAEVLCRKGFDVVVIEKSKTIGRKVCAGGITWSGLIGRIPDSLFERTFLRQSIITPRQHVQLESEQPIIATVNREALGQFMCKAASDAGAEIILGAQLTSIEQNSVSFRQKQNTSSISYDYLVGADGSNSRVRKFLGIATGVTGLGLNYIVPQILSEMVWHFNASEFGSGYSWIFPHRHQASVGAYIGRPAMSAANINRNLVKWLALRDISVQGLPVQAERINYDFRGWSFGRRFLVGDAAGLASPLTGEGIFPAILSAESVANTIEDPEYVPEQFIRLIKKHRKHLVMLKLSGASPIVASFLAELSAFLLKYRMISFEKFEMA